MPKSFLFDKLFPCSYILTIKDFKNRHLRLEKIFETHQISNARFYFGKKHIFKSIFKNTASRGITETHLELHKLAQKKHSTNVIIFEDDISFVDNFKQKLDPILEDLKGRDWDIFYFFKPFKGNLSDDYGTGRGEVLQEFDSGLLKVQGTINAHAMALNIKNIDKIRQVYNLNFIKKLPLQIRVIDKSLAATKLNMFACNEDFIYQSEDFHSSTMYAKTNASLLENIKLYFNPVGKKVAKTNQTKAQ